MLRHFKPDLTVQTGVRQVIVRTPAHRSSRLSRHPPSIAAEPSHGLPRYGGAGGDHEKLPVSVFQNRSA
jgi:hypothetical protein